MQSNNECKATGNAVHGRCLVVFEVIIPYLSLCRNLEHYALRSEMTLFIEHIYFNEYASNSLMDETVL